MSECFSYEHDKAYEKAGTSGIKGALFNLDVANADLELAAGNFYNVFLADNSNDIDRVRSYLTMEAFAVIGTGKIISIVDNEITNVLIKAGDLISTSVNNMTNEIIDWFK